MQETGNIAIETQPSGRFFGNAGLEDKVIEAVLGNTAGVGLGMIITVAGVIAVAKWLGIREMIQSWIHKEKQEAESLATLTENLAALSRSSSTAEQTQSEILNQGRELSNQVEEGVNGLMKDIEEVQTALNNVKQDVTQIKEDVGQLKQDLSKRSFTLW